MLSTSNLGSMLPSLAFFIAAFVLAVTPGPGIAYVVARTAAGGRAEGLASCIGTGLGGMLHVGAAALGLSVLLAQSAVAFSLVKYIGAAYLVYLGIRLLLSKAVSAPVHTKSTGSRRALLEGILVEALNVKTALFFLAFLPQFADPAHGPVALQIVALGCLFNLSGTLVNVVVACLASSVRQWLIPGQRGERIFRWLTGTVFIGLGIRLALADRR